jgi:hypothetical protein
LRGAQLRNNSVYAEMNLYKGHTACDMLNTAWLKSTEMMPKTAKKTYNSGYSLVVTHLTTNPPVRCLNRAERTGSLVFNVLWSYVIISPIY